MGCGASKEGIVEPQSIQFQNCNKLSLKDKEGGTLKPNEVTYGLNGSECICSLYNNVIPFAKYNNLSSPPSIVINTSNESVSSDEDGDNNKDFDRSFEFQKKLEIVEEDNINASQTTALAALSGEKDVSDKELEDRVDPILAANDGELILPDESEQCCALGVLSQPVLFQAILSSGPVLTQQILGGDLSSTRVGHVAVISGLEPIHWETPLRKAEIIDLDEEQNASESLMLENTPEHQENQLEQAHKHDDAMKLEDIFIASLTTEQSQRYLKLQQLEDISMHKDVLSLEPRKGKLPPLSIVPPIRDPFIKLGFPLVVKQDVMEVKVHEPQQFEDLLVYQTSPLGMEFTDSPTESNHKDKRSKSSLVIEHCEDGTPTTKSFVDNGWRSPHCDFPDPDIENITLLESLKEMDNQLPLMSMLDCHGIHMDKKDLISPSLQCIS